MASANKMRRLKYSCEEVYERMDNGLCIFCDELDTPGHHDLKHKGIQIFMVECDDDQVSGYEEEAHQVHETLTNPAPIEKNVYSDQICDKKEVVSIDLDQEKDRNKTVAEEKLNLSLGQNVEHLVGKHSETVSTEFRSFVNLLSPDQKDSTVIESSNKDDPSFSHKDDRVWEPGGLPTKMDIWDWKELKPYGESHKVKSNPEFNTFESNKTFSLEDEHDDETNVETKSLLEKETIPSSVLCDQVPATQSQDNNMIQQEELVHDTETIMEMGPIQEPEPLELADSIFEVDFLHSQEFPSQCQVPIPSLEPSRRCQKESLAVIYDLSCDLGCVIGKTVGSICDSELGQDNSHDEEELIGLNFGKLLKNERLFSIICLLGLNDMSCWTQLLRQQIFPKSWRFKFKTESSGEAILLKQHDDSVETNLVKFERALSRLSLPVAHALNIFLTNMSFHLASHVRQFDVTTIADAVWIAKRCESSLLQYSSATQSRAPFSPYQSYNDQPYYEGKFGECPEIEFDRESDEIKDVKLQDKQPEEDVKTLVISENEQSLECVGDEPFDDEKPGEVIVEEIVDEPVESSVVRDVKSTINDVDMDNQLVLLENKKLLNIEAGDKKEKNSILSGKIAAALARKKCMVSKVDQSTFDLERDQIQFNNKEEFVGLTESSELRPSREFLLMNFGIFMNPQLLHDRRIIQALLVGIVGTKEKLYDRLSLANYVWKSGELLCVQDQWDGISEVHSGELQEWNDVVAGHLLFDMVEKGNYLDEVIEEAAKTFTLTMIDEHKDIKTACVFLEMSLNRERLIQLGAPPVFSDWLCAMNRIQVRLKMVLLQEFLWLTLFSSKMFKSSYVPQNKNQTNQKLSSYWKLLLRLLYPLHNNEWRSFYMLMIKSAFKGKEKTVSFNIAVTSCSRFGFFSYSSWMGSHNSYDLSSCVLRQEKNYVMALFPIGEALTLVNDQHTLVAQKKGTETSTGCCYGFHADLDLMADVTSGTADISKDEFSSVCKLLFGVFVLNLIADQVRDWSFFGLLLQWKWHPPPQATSEFHQAHNDKPVFHL